MSDAYIEGAVTKCHRTLEDVGLSITHILSNEDGMPGPGRIVNDGFSATS